MMAPLITEKDLSILFEKFTESRYDSPFLLSRAIFSSIALLIKLLTVSP